MYAVIFDMDGVLVDSSRAHFSAWSELGEQVGTPFTPDLFAQTFGMHNQQIFPMWLGDLPQPRVEELSLAKEALYREKAAQEMRGLEGAVELVRALDAAGFKLAVGSSGPHANVQLILDLLGIGDLFDALSTGDEVHHGKPDPEVFLKAAQKLDLPPSQCVVVEDAVQGVEAARRAGMKVIAVTSSRPAADLADADRVVDSLAHLTPGDFTTLLES